MNKDNYQTIVDIVYQETEFEVERLIIYQSPTFDWIIKVLYSNSDTFNVDTIRIPESKIRASSQHMRLEIAAEYISNAIYTHATPFYANAIIGDY